MSSTRYIIRIQGEADKDITRYVREMASCGECDGDEYMVAQCLWENEAEANSGKDVDLITRQD